MRNLIRSVCLAVAVLTGLAPAVAQNFPQTLPANTVVGRLGVAAGPTEAIPFARFITALPLAAGKILIGSVNGFVSPQTPSGDCTVSTAAVITCTQSVGGFTVNGVLAVTGGVLLTNIVAPATPASGKTQVYVDSTNKVLSAKNDAGTVSNTVVPSAAVANQFMTGIGVAGVITRAQPSFANLSGSWTCAQAPAFTGNVTTSAGACVTTIAALAVTNGMLAGSIAAAKLVGTDIATVGTITTGTWNGTKVGLAYGGTNADLSATGGTSQFLKQASAGAAITVVRPACADLSNAAASCSTDTTTQTNVAFTGLSAAAAAADADTFPTNQGAANLKQTLAAIKTWIKAWIAKADVGLGNVANVDTTNAANISSGTLPAGRLPALTGDVTTSAGSAATTLATGNAGNLNSGTLLAARMMALTGDCTTSAGAVATTCTKINGVDQTAAWTAYTPAVTAQTNTITTLGTVTGRYKQIGKTIHAQMEVNITTAGTATGSLRVTLPFTAANFAYVGNAFSLVNAKSGGAAVLPAVSLTYVSARDATNATFIADGADIAISITYEVP